MVLCCQTTRVQLEGKHRLVYKHCLFFTELFFVFVFVFPSWVSQFSPVDPIQVMSVQFSKCVKTMPCLIQWEIFFLMVDFSYTGYSGAKSRLQCCELIPPNPHYRKKVNMAKVLQVLIYWMNRFYLIQSLWYRYDIKFCETPRKAF